MFRKLLFISVTVFAISGCSENDVQYYKSHLDKAESKIKECESELKKAFISQDKQKFAELSEDSECKAAQQAHAEHQQELRQAQQKREQEQFEKELKEYTDTLSSMPIEEFYLIRNECQFSSGSDSTKCKAFNDLKDDKFNYEIKKLIDEHDGDSLQEYSEKQCKGIEYKEVTCELSRNAVDKQRQDQVDYYLANREELKLVFNTCQAEHSKLQQAKKYKEASQLAQTFDCNVVAAAASKLNVRSFYKPID